jgi:hypothetical protein
MACPCVGEVAGMMTASGFFSKRRRLPMCGVAATGYKPRLDQR